ncbi:hypothetical protein [uncultured Mitsuokella sp.]|uniref:hypothetical protein n=1 Tax=uncultured Mitsuokella sp. TaxID=453120 RepID=UPI00258C16EF|nr:hypothetical protein [uncultured Mitsuokella sp.]
MKYAILSSSFDAFCRLSDYAGAGNYEPFDAPSDAVAAVVSRRCDALLVDRAYVLAEDAQKRAAAVAYIIAYGGSVVTPDGVLGGPAA